MASLTASEIEVLGPIIEPFTRAKPDPEKKIKDGEDDLEIHSQYIHVVTFNGWPPKYITLTLEEVEMLLSDPLEFRKNKALYRMKCFLWVIDENNRLRIIRERISNPKRTHDSEYVCHTNLTGGAKAYLGGEMLFGDDGNIYVNYFSDRYGNPQQEQWEVAKNFFRRIGYSSIIDILEIIKEKYAN